MNQRVTPRRTWALATGLIMVAGAAHARPVESPLGFPAEAQPATTMPDTPAGRRVAAFFDAINAGDPAAYEAYSQRHRTAGALARATPQRRAEQYQQFTSEWGTLKVERIVQEGDALVVIARATRRDESVLFRFETSPQDDGRIEALRIEPAGPASWYGIEQSPAWREWESLGEFLETVRRDTGIPAIAAGVVKDGRLVESVTVGATRFGGGEPVGPDARFHWGSLTKAVTATAIASLVERGVLSWDTTVGEALHGVPMLDAYRAVTLRQLLSHTAGVPQYTTIVGADARRMFAYTGSPQDRRAAFVRDLLQESPLFEPGTSFRYSNAGYGLAAHMAESMSGIAWEDLVDRGVFQPLAMTHAGLGLPSDLSDHEPMGHTGMGPQFAPTSGNVPDLPGIWPAGNVHSDIEDLATFAAFHLAGLRGHDGALRASTVAFLHEPAPGSEGAGFSGGYALGWAVDAWPRPDVVSHAHNGSAGTYYATMRLFPDQDLAIVVLMNVGMPGDMLAPKIERAIYDRFGRP